jgi:hypothetical protein
MPGEVDPRQSLTANRMNYGARGHHWNKALKWRTRESDRDCLRDFNLLSGDLEEITSRASADEQSIYKLRPL